MPEQIAPKVMHTFHLRCAHKRRPPTTFQTDTSNRITSGANGNVRGLNGAAVLAGIERDAPCGEGRVMASDSTALCNRRMPFLEGDDNGSVIKKGGKRERRLDNGFPKRNSTRAVVHEARRVKKNVTHDGTQERGCMRSDRLPYRKGDYEIKAATAATLSIVTSRNQKTHLCTN